MHLGPSDLISTDSDASGVLGLAPEDSSAGPLFVSYLYDQSQIKANAFSLVLSHDPSKDSYLTFGGLPTFLAHASNEFICHRVAGSFHWEMKLLGIKVGEEGIVDDLETPLMLTDTGTTLTYLPSADYEKFMQMICSDLDCSLDEEKSPPQYVVNNCDLQRFKPVWF